MVSAPPCAGPARESQLALPRSAVRLLAACAKSAELCPELELGDSFAAGFFAELGGSFQGFGSGELRCSAFRTSVVDRLTQTFFDRHPAGTGVSLWPMLGTRAHRLHERNWLELDAPPLAALRERYLPARPGWKQLASCLCSAGKVAHDFGAPGPRLFVLDEAVLPLHSEVTMRVLDSICAHAACGSELILAFDSRTDLRALGSGTLELAHQGDLVRYPRLRVVDQARYADDLRSSLRGINVIARLQGHDTPALAHLLVL